MEWITTNEFIEMLKRFPDTKIMAKLGSDHMRELKHAWMYDSKNKLFIHDTIKNDVSTEITTEQQFVNQYNQQHWRPNNFFHINDNKQKELAVRIVEHIIQLGELDSVLCDYNISFVRECQHCHKLITEGWSCAATYTYCSDECLLKENTNITIKELQDIANDETNDVYWTEWED